MNTRGNFRHLLSILLFAGTVISLALTACQAVKVSVVEPTATAAQAAYPVAATAQPQVAQPTDAIVQPPVDPKKPAGRPLDAAEGDVTLDLAGVAQSQTLETVAAVPPNSNAFWTGVMPEHRVVTLQGYPVTNHMMRPQIFIYPVGELALYNKNARQVATDLQNLLANQQPGNELPYLPLINAKQVIHPQVQYLDFKNGKGVRYLTQFNTGIVVINNHQLLYTYQGLTSDGKYYVAAVLPVTHANLPETEQVSAQPENHLSELATSAAWLDQEPGGSFTPDLAKLDALVQSMEIK